MGGVYHLIKGGAYECVSFKCSARPYSIGKLIMLRGIMGFHTLIFADTRRIWVYSRFAMARQPGYKVS